MKLHHISIKAPSKLLGQEKTYLVILLLYGGG